MKNNRVFVYLLFAIAAGLWAPLHAQVTVHKDGTVSFCYCGKAKKVSVFSDLYYEDEDSTRYTDHNRKIKMQRGDDGCFYVTTRPVQPEMYTYCFRVDGKRMPDPMNQDTAWQMMHKWNIVCIGGTKQSDRYRQPTEQGTLYSGTWYSSSEQLYRRVNIYTPAGYDSCNSTLPVMYLIHGINGYEGSWGERGRAIQIVENLVNEKRIPPMIIVMPDCNVGVHEDRPSHHTLWKNVINYPKLCHNHDIEKALVELIQMVDSSYRVGDNRYIAGFSDGARIAANTANELPGYFSAVGLFSPVVHKEQLPQDSTVVYVYTGTKDMFHNNAKRFERRLREQRVEYHYVETSGGHTWRNWRKYLSDFIVQATDLSVK